MTATILAPKRRQLLALVVGVAAVLLLTGGTIGVAINFGSSRQGATVDMRGHEVAADPGNVPDAATETAMRVTADIGVRLVVPSVGLDVPVGALDAVQGNIDPPGFTSAYVVRNRGVSLAHASEGTVFVVMHSMRNGGLAPGNYLIDIAAGKAKVRIGAKIAVGTVTYAVDGSDHVSKTQLASNATVWANVPNRLVLITCLQVPAGTASVDNLVITASRTP